MTGRDGAELRGSFIKAQCHRCFLGGGGGSVNKMHPGFGAAYRRVLGAWLR